MKPPTVILDEIGEEEWGRGLVASGSQVMSFEVIDPSLLLPSVKAAEMAGFVLAVEVKKLKIHCLFGASNCCSVLFRNACVALENATARRILVMLAGSTLVHK